MGGVGRKRSGCVTGPGAVCGGPLEEAAGAAPPSSPVSPAWHCRALSGAPGGEGGNSATLRTTSRPRGSPGCPCWAWWVQNRARKLCPCRAQRHLPGTQTCDSGLSNRRTGAAKYSKKNKKPIYQLSSSNITCSNIYQFHIYLIVRGEDELEDNHQAY